MKVLTILSAVMFATFAVVGAVNVDDGQPEKRQAYPGVMHFESMDSFRTIWTFQQLFFPALV
ncbi:uncharacterized protein N7484_006754 [Penicillium longicatenatum]|uniref:uncharacterized protein n=1 Tax=Penicillium longicatenatum TaxID=1561947 RepID=UPI002548742A|nr:uncharacterized protein N7484_006754 [Penicillium longicatenatum]KAJ5644247.1 hypothetical protein N7484_006754 [Penicillium longicatenatum]